MSLDDESSDEEICSTTNVLLGYASKEPTGDEISFLGGTPSWLGDTRPSYDLVQCKLCKNVLSQLLQLNGELPDRFPTHDRRLHILACRRKACSRKTGSIRVLRATRHAAASSTDKLQQPAGSSQHASSLGNDIFGGASGSVGASTNPFSKPTGNATNPFAKPSSSISTSTIEQPKSTPEQPTYASAAQPLFAPKAAKVQPWPEDIETNDYPKLYLDAGYESLEQVDTPEASNVPRITEIDDDSMDTGGPSSAKEDSEVYESSIDKTFQRFADRLAQNPEQILRYEFKGNPLLYSATDDVGKILHPPSGGRVSTAARGIPGCSNCSKARVFEIQLTPHAILDLEGDELSLDGMEWGTIIVGVCEANCQARGIEDGNVGYLEEWVGTQWEERGK